jgi:hypothetical protein
MSATHPVTLCLPAFGILKERNMCPSAEYGRFWSYAIFAFSIMCWISPVLDGESLCQEWMRSLRSFCRLQLRVQFLGDKGRLDWQGFVDWSLKGISGILCVIFFELVLGARKSVWRGFIGFCWWKWGIFLLFENLINETFLFLKIKKN